MVRKQFYDSLLNDYFDGSRTIVITTHQIDEIQDVLTDFLFVNGGRIVLQSSMEAFESRYLETMVNLENVAAARTLHPIHERQVFGRSIMLFDSTDRQRLAALGEVRTPSIADLFVAVMDPGAGPMGGATRLTALPPPPRWIAPTRPWPPPPCRKRARFSGRCGASCGRTVRSFWPP